MKKLFLLLVTVLSLSVCASAQMRTVVGTVLEEGGENEPIVGASVTPAGSKLGVVTDFNGEFRLQVAANVKNITVSSVGYTSKTVAITSGHMTITLSSSSTVLDEVMVVAYGREKKSEYTGSASVVKADQLQDALVSNVTNALSGKMAGVQTMSSNGAPGQGSSVLIRGVGSINGSTAPLYVVDGFPYEGSINDIASSDIESITVLKDAASTALYGARGANGVIMITTKRGKAGEAQVTFDARWGGNSRALSNYDVITDPGEYFETLYRSFYTTRYMDSEQGGDVLAAHRYANSSIWGALGQRTYSVPDGQDLIGLNGKFNPNATPGYSDGNYYYTPDNWADETFRTGLRQDYSLSVRGGVDRFTYYLSANYLGDEGILEGSHFKRLSTRAAVEYQAKDWLKIGTQLNYIYKNTGYPDSQTSASSNSSANAFAVVNELAPVFPIYVRDAQGRVMYNEYYGKPLYDFGLPTDYGYGRLATRSSGAWATANPAGALAYDKREFISDVFNGKWYAILTPLKGLTVSGTAELYLVNQKFNELNNSLYGQLASFGGRVQQQMSRTSTVSLQGLVDYTRTFGEHTVGVMAAVESQDYRTEYVSASGQNLYQPDVDVVNNSIDNLLGSGARAALGHRSVLARLKYNFANRYYLQASWRRDGSSAFAKDHRWGSFWSVSAGWDINREAFMAEAKDVVDLLKFKASFGQNGNDNIYDSTLLQAYQDYYTMRGSDGVFSDSELAYKGNPDITWEKSNNFNVGFDFSFWKGKLAGTLEYYSRQTSDMLMYLPVNPSLGYSSYPKNVGSMRNNGFELELNYNVFKNKNIDVSVFANATLPSNKVLDIEDALKNNNGQWEYSSTRIIEEGKSLYNMWLVHYAGVDENGVALYTARRNVKDENGNDIQIGTGYLGEPIYQTEEYTTTDYSKARSTNRKETGNIMPKVYGGFGLDAKAYGFDLSVQFAYQAGGKIFDSTYQGFMDPGTSSYLGRTWHKDIAKAWSPTNTNTDVPRMANEGLASQYANATSDRFLISSNYLSLNNITLGYTFPKAWTSKLGLGELRIYGAAENVALWSKRKGLDPRQGFLSSNNSTYSPIRTVSGGLRVSF